MKRCLLLGALLAPLAVFSNEPTTLDPVTTTATRTETQLSRVAASLVVIDRAEIERAQANDLADLLRGIAGIDVARSGGPGAPASVFIRGAESNHTLFLVDGVRYTTETFLNAQIQNLAPELIERIEIVNGPRSAQWGSDAIGGVVQIVTRRGGAGTQGNLALRGGSYGTREMSGGVSHVGEQGEIAFNLQAQEFDGYPPLQTGTEDRGHDNLSGQLAARLMLGRGEVGLRHWQAEGTNEYAGFSGEARSQDYENRISTLELELPVTAPWTTRLTASHAHDALMQREPDDPARPANLSATIVERRTVEWLNEFHFDALTLLGGLASSRSELDSVFFSGFGDSETQDETRRDAAFAQAQWAEQSFDTLVALRYTDHEQFGSVTTGNFELGYALTGSLRLGLAAGSAFKEPDLTDLFGAFGNPDLRPERSRSAELNVRYALGSRHVFTAALYENRIEDMIEFDPATFVPFNQSTRNRGLEAGWRYEGEALGLRISGNLQNPESEVTGARAPRRSRESGLVGANYRVGRAEFGGELQASGDRVDSNGARLAGYALLGAHLRVSLAQGLSLALRGDNLLDRDYELIDGFRTPQRSGYLTLRYGF